MAGAVSHIKSNGIADFTGTVTVMNSAGSTETKNATDLVRPSDWNSVHNAFLTIGGNTNNASTWSGTNLQLSFNGAITGKISGNTLEISAAVARNFFAPIDEAEFIAGQVGQGTLHIRPVAFPYLAFDRAVMPVFNTNSSNSSGSHTLSFWAGIYSQNVSTLSLLASASFTTALTHSGTAGSYSLYSGMRNITMGWSTTIPEGDYWLAIVSRTTSGGANGSYSQAIRSNLASNFLGNFGASHATTIQRRLGYGFYTATTSGMPGSIAFSEIQGSNSALFRDPILNFHNGTA